MLIYVLVSCYVGEKAGDEALREVEEAEKDCYACGIQLWTNWDPDDLAMGRLSEQKHNFRYWADLMFFFKKIMPL